MAIKAKLPFLLLCFLFVASLSVSLSFAYGERGAEGRLRPREEREHERQREREGEEQWPGRRDPERQRRQDPEERRRKEQYRREREQEQEQGRQGREQEEEKEQERQSQRQNPYYYRSHRFQTRYRSEHGHIRTLPRFDRSNRNLRGLQNYRLVEFQSKPQTFLLPHHSDAEYLVLVVRGSALFTIVNRNNRESYNLKRDDVLRIPAGATVYAANADDSQNLRVINLAIPVNNPGQYEDFFPGGQQNPQSYYNGFSRQTLEATFNAQYQEIQRALLGEQSEEEEEESQEEQRQPRGRGKREESQEERSEQSEEEEEESQEEQRQPRGRGRKEKSQEEQSEEGQSQRQNQGAIVRASREQIRQLSQDAQSSQKGGQSKSGPFNLRNLENRYSNNYGKFWEARPDQLPQLQDLDVSITLTDLNRGALFLPHLNSEATVVAYVAQGNGRLEIASPQRRPSSQEREQEQEEQEQEQEEQQEQEQRSGQIERLTAQLNEGDVFVVPAGYPFALRASNNNNLLVVGFDINAENNQRNFLAGEKDNVINQIDRAAKELTFSGSAQQVERLLRNQKQSYFVNAQPQQQQQQQREGRKEERKGPLSSILGSFM